MLKRERLYSIGQICLIYFGPNIHPSQTVTLAGGTKKTISKPHQQYHSVRRKVMYHPDVKKDLGTGRKKRTYWVPGWLVINIFGEISKGEEAA
jgi:hypothetical protein